VRRIIHLGGDFIYSPYEVEVMLSDIQLCKELGADGVAIGTLREDGSLDLEVSLRVC
jgi:copper homeostasis protein